MIEVFLIYALLEYPLQPEQMLSAKRTLTLKGFGWLLLHAVVPAALVVTLTEVSWVSATALVLGHMLIDGAVGQAIVRLLPSQSVLRLMSDRDHDAWPIQVQALQFALVTAHEKMTYATLHAAVIYASLTWAPLLEGGW